MKYVTCFGMLVRLTDAKYQEFLTRKVEGEDTDVFEFGTQVGTVIDVTDLSGEDASTYLETRKAKRRRRRSQPRRD